MPIKPIAITCVITTALLIGCSSSDDDDEGSDTPATDASNQTSMPAPGVDQGNTAETVSRFNGSYLRDCMLSGDDDEIWETFELTIEEGVFNSIFTEYSDAQCTQIDVIQTVDASVEFPGGTADTALGAADFINITPESATVNGQSFPAINEVFFDLILLEGNSLYFGLETDELTGETAETRPVEVDVDLSLMLQ